MLTTVGEGFLRDWRDFEQCTYFREMLNILGALNALPSLILLFFCCWLLTLLSRLLRGLVFLVGLYGARSAPCFTRRRYRVTVVILHPGWRVRPDVWR